MNIVSLFLYLTAAFVIGGVISNPEIEGADALLWVALGTGIAVIGKAVQGEHGDSP